MKKIVKAGLGYTVGNYLIKGLSFLTIPVFARLMDSNDYGIYNTYIAYESIMYILIGLALHVSFKKAKYKFDEHFNVYVSSCVLLGIMNSIVWIVLVNSIYGKISDQLRISRLILNILILHSLGSALIQYYNAYVSLYYDYLKFLKISFFNALINVLGSVLLILFVFPEKRYYGRILGASLPIILIGIYIVIYFFKNENPVCNKKMWNFSIKYSLPIIPHGISQIILSQFDRIMISNIIGVSQAGIYSFAYNVYSIIQVTSNSLSNVWEPWFFERMNEKDYVTIESRGFLLGFGMLLFSAIMCLVSPEMILVLGTNKYMESVHCVIPIIIGGYFSFLYILPCEVEYYHEKTQFIAIGTSVAALINLVLNYICINRFGYVAAAYTTLVTYLIYFTFHYFIARRIEKKFIYSNRKILLLVLGALFVGTISISLLDFMILRWGIVFVIMTCIFGYCQKKYNLVCRIKNRISRYKGNGNERTFFKRNTK